MYGIGMGMTLRCPAGSPACVVLKHSSKTSHIMKTSHPFTGHNALKHHVKDERRPTTDMLNTDISCRSTDFSLAPSDLIH